MNRLAKLAWSPVVATASRRSFSAAKTYKSSTGIVGLAVDPNGRENLAKISQQILDEVKVSIEIVLGFIQSQFLLFALISRVFRRRASTELMFSRFLPSFPKPWQRRRT